MSGGVDINFIDTPPASLAGCFASRTGMSSTLMLGYSSTQGVATLSRRYASSITEEADNSGFRVWPYRAEQVSANGDRNNGGIDLVANPEKIDIIHEATEENGLRPLLISMNSPGQAFMTLGCLSGPMNGAYYSYVEFTPRDPSIARSKNAIIDIHRQWLDWLEDLHAEHPEVADALHQCVVWEYRAFSFHGSAPQYLITIWSRTASAQDHGSLMSWVHSFLSMIKPDELPSLPANQL